METGRLEVDALDCLDGTPILDVKPWRPAVDIPPGVPADATVNLSLALTLDSPT